MKPLKNNIIVAQEQQKKTTESGIILQSAVNEETLWGVVLAVGPDVSEVKVSQKVIPDWSKAVSMTVGDVQTAVISEDNILAIVE